jgi:hypothetical protein
MPQISPTEFYALPLRVHTFLADVPLHDVWAVDLPTHRDGVNLSEFLRRASQGGIMRRILLLAQIVAVKPHVEPRTHPLSSRTTTQSVSMPFAL